MKTFVALPILGLVLWASVHAGEQIETIAGWVKHAENPVLGGDLDSCWLRTMMTFATILDLRASVRVHSGG